ncbi:CPBP family intramembrane glutamic endopeptidase [Halobellus salinisoli]|uniref:CPBP family intramembrane glutamic endopeptidase n=1 Tax=Halobellus salinisoli TaxID=3108500 RepID=UPI00300A0ED6
MQPFPDDLGFATGSDSSTRRAQVIAVTESVSLTIGSVLAGIGAVLIVATGIQAIDVPSMDAVQLLRSRAIQLGFLGVSLAYLTVREFPLDSITFRVPSLRGVAWIVAIPVLTAGAGFVLEPLLAAVGIVQPPASPGMGIDGFGTRPLLWIVVFVGWFVFAAPAEELLFRGIIQGRLRQTFEGVPGILLAAVCFGLMHVPVAALSAGMGPASAFVETSVSGAIFGVAYERTGNLLVPSVAHALLWTGGLVL